MCLGRQREYVCVGLKNASAYVPMRYILKTAFFNDRAGEFGLFQARAVDTGNSHRLTARLY